jgi:hypothetical protein
LIPRQCIYLTNDRGEAVGYAIGNADTKAKGITDYSGANVIPAYIKGNHADLRADSFNSGKVNVQEYIENNDMEGMSKALQEAGFDGFIMNDLAPIPSIGDHAVVFDPKNIRSVNAKFDPAKKDSANLLDSRLLPIPAAGLLGAYMLNKKDETN